MTPGADTGPNLLLDWRDPSDSARYWRAGVGSLVVHTGIIALGFLLASLDIPAPREATEIVPNFKEAVHLVLPSDLTQKAPNKGKVAKEVNVEDLKPRPASQERLPPAPAVRAFQPPRPQPPGPSQSPAAPRIAEPPKIESQVTAQNAPALPPALAGQPKAPPTQIQPVEQPKLAFETPGQAGPSENKGQGKLTPPKSDIQTVVHDMARAAGGGGREHITVSDLDLPPELSSPSMPGQQQQLGSSMELKSDPMGADFKPYLIRVLALVKKNWYAVVPPNARMGGRAVVEIQFIIDRKGAVPKLVIATESGTSSLDRLAVAGIDRSQPFPPFPQDFKGEQIRLQLAFKY